jgi:hypothetical protein
MHKIVEIDPYFPTGELSVQPVILWANGRPCYEEFTKHASVANDYFKTITPVPGHSIVYVLALGSWEFYGENRNGDGFPESPYMTHMNPAWISDKETLIQHYKSFDTAHNFRHHQNRDPNKSVGKVLKSFWNPTMHRVELVVDLENAKAPDLVERIAAGEFPPVSMGTRVPYDVCSICGNRAPTRAQYCNHLKFQMKDVIDGKKVAALNPSPKFFDISWVFRPADATAFMLKKVAHEHAYELISGAAGGEYLDAVELQKQAAKKLAVIDKVVEGVGVDALPDGMAQEEYENLVKMQPYAQEIAKNTPDLPEEILQKLSAYPLAEIMSSAMYTGGIQLSPAEILKISSYQAGLRGAVTGAMLEKAAAVQSGMIGLFEDYPQVVDQLVKQGAVALDGAHVNPDVVSLFTPYIEKRGGMYEYLKRRVVPEDWREESANTTLLTVTDPATGERYMTTRGAAVAAHDEIARVNLLKTLGGAAMLGGAYKLVGSALPRSGMARPLLAGGLAAVGGANLPSMGAHYMTDQGVPIPSITELQKSSADIALPTLTALGIMAALAYDHKRRGYSHIPIGHPALPMPRRVLDNLGEFTTNHPIISLLGGTAALAPAMRSKGVSSLAAKLRNHVEPAVKGTMAGLRGKPVNVKVSALLAGEKLANVIPIETAQSTSSVLLPEVNLDKLASYVGWLIVGD